MSGIRAIEQRPTVEEALVNLLRTGGPMQLGELVGELSVLCRCGLVDAESVSDDDARRGLAGLLDAGQVCCEAGEWDWVPPRIATGPRQGVLFGKGGDV